MQPKWLGILPPTWVMCHEKDTDRDTERSGFALLQGCHTTWGRLFTAHRHRAERVNLVHFTSVQCGSSLLWQQLSFYTEVLICPSNTSLKRQARGSRVIIFQLGCAGLPTALLPFPRNPAPLPLYSRQSLPPQGSLPATSPSS